MSEPTESFKIFYAWQADVSSNRCRKLIADALDIACQKLTDSGKYPYLVEVDADTRGVNGLCDIPAIILGKIRDADAFLADLTLAYALNDADDRSPNPNVMLELGYAMHSVATERIVTVMNESLGSPENAMPFDIANRRWPIRYSWPNESKKITHEKTVEELSDKLVEALDGIVALGPRRFQGEDESEFISEINEIDSLYAGTQSDLGITPTATIIAHPTRYVQQWPDTASLEQVIRASTLRSVRGRDFPMTRNGTGVMPWGLLNSQYRPTAWALTHSGMFWSATNVSANKEYEIDEFDAQQARTRPRTLGWTDWLDFLYWRADTAIPFRFIGRLANQYPAGERLTVIARAAPLNGKYLANSDYNINLDFRPAAVTPYVEMRETIDSQALGTSWGDICVKFQAKLYNAFDGYGRESPEQGLWDYLRKQFPGGL